MIYLRKKYDNINKGYSEIDNHYSLYCLPYSSTNAQSPLAAYFIRNKAYFSSSQYKDSP